MGLEAWSQVPCGEPSRGRFHGARGAAILAEHDVPTSRSAAAGCDTAFTVDASRVTFGRGCLVEVGDRARALGMHARRAVHRRTAARAPVVRRGRALARAAGSTSSCSTRSRSSRPIASFAAAAQFARDAEPDGYVSLGGGSVIDTCKAANLYATIPRRCAPTSTRRLATRSAIPGPLAPHIACPTTSGTGSEVTGIAIFDWLEHHAKTGHRLAAAAPDRSDRRSAHARARCPPTVVAASGMDVLCHALESYTARPYSQRARAGRADRATDEPGR